MKTDGQRGDTPQGREDEDALWRLLERAPQPKPVSPYFARRVLREVAALEAARPAAADAPNWLARTWRAWHRTPGVAFASALAVVTLLAGGLFAVRRPVPVNPAVVIQPTPETPDTNSPEEAGLVDLVAGPNANPASSVAAPTDPVVTAQDVEVIADLDNVLSREESRLWTEDDNTARF